MGVRIAASCCQPLQEIRVPRGALTGPYVLSVISVSTGIAKMVVPRASRVQTAPGPIRLFIRCAKLRHLRNDTQNGKLIGPSRIGRHNRRAEPLSTVLLPPTHRQKCGFPQPASHSPVTNVIESYSNSGIMSSVVKKNSVQK